MDANSKIASHKGWTLEGKAALVTGATKGIGKGIAEELLGFGAAVTEGIDECAAERENNGFKGKVGGSTCDVTIPEDRIKLVKEAVAFFGGKLDILVDYAALNHLVRVLACERTKDGIGPNAVAPGVIGRVATAPVLAFPEFLQEYTARAPAGRIGTIEECATAVAFVCLPSASYINGQTIVIDGGISVNGFHISKLDEDADADHTG